VKKGAQYSDRPEMKLFKEWCGWNWSVVSLNDGPEMKLHRRLLADSLSAKASKDFEGDLRQGAINLAERLVKMLPHREDGNWREWCHLMVAGNIFKVSYGYEAQENDDPWIKRIKRMQELLVDLGVLGTKLVDRFPFLKYVPSRILFGPKGSKNLSELREILSSIFNDQFRFASANIARGENNNSYVFRMIQNTEEFMTMTGFGKNLTKKEVLKAIQSTSATMPTAGTETIESSMNSFILAMVLHPEAQSWARDQLDTYMRSQSRENDLPDFSDRGADGLAAIDAVVWEVLRWEPAAPLAVPRETKQDDVYNGMSIPSGSLIMANSWCVLCEIFKTFSVAHSRRLCLHDPDRYPDPYLFDPKRFMSTMDGSDRKGRPQEDPREYTFGYGRRICPGRIFAESTLWITIATLLSLFTFECPLDESGQPIKPSPVYKFGIAVQFPEPFRFLVKLREDGEKRLEKALARSL